MTRRWRPHSKKSRHDPLETIRKNLVVTGTVEGIGFAIPADTKLPPVEGLSAQLTYSKGLLTITQGSAKFGNSAVHDLIASANLANGVEGADYKTSVSVDADLAELFPAIAQALRGVTGAATRSPRALERPRPGGHQRIGKVDGEEPGSAQVISSACRRDRRRREYQGFARAAQGFARHRQHQPGYDHVRPRDARPRPVATRPSTAR